MLYMVMDISQLCVAFSLSTYALFRRMHFSAKKTVYNTQSALHKSQALCGIAVSTEDAAPSIVSECYKRPQTTKAFLKLSYTFPLSFFLSPLYVLCKSLYCFFWCIYCDNDMGMVLGYTASVQQQFF